MQNSNDKKAYNAADPFEKVKPIGRLFLLSGLSFIALILLYMIHPIQTIEPQLKSGLTVWQPEEGIIPLSGEWEYMAGMLNTSGWEDASYATLPGTWEGNRFGYASYRSIIEGIDPAAEYGLLLPYQATAYRLYLDGDLIVSNGTVGINRPSSVPKYLPETFHFIPSKSSAELVLQVSNFHHRRGGPFQTIYFGERQKIERMESGNVVRDWVFVIMFATMSLYQFTFLIVRKHRTGLYLALFFLFVSINGMIGTPEVLIFRIFPDFPWALYQKLCYYVSYITPIWLVLFVYTLYGGVSRKTVAALCLPFVAIALFVTVTPSYVFSVLNEPFQVYSVFIISIVLAMLISAFRKKLPGTKAMLLGFAVLMASMYGGIFFSNNRITNAPFLPLSFLKYYDASLFQVMPVSLATLSYILLMLLLNVFSLSYFYRHPTILKSNSIPGSWEPLDEQRIAQIGTVYSLSKREMEVVFLMLRGRTNQQICDTLFISMSTVKTHISRIFRKTGVDSRSGLFFLFQRGGLQERAGSEANAT